MPGVQYHTLGVGAMALIVHKNNPINNLSSDQVRRIFMGEISNWSQITTALGKKGPDLKIRPTVRLHCKLRPGHWRLILDNENQFSANVRQVGSIPDMVLSGISSYDGAIGYETIGNIRHYNKDMNNLKILRVDGFSPFDGKLCKMGTTPSIAPIT